MGREYFGDIEGKFWFAVQSSNDADHFGGNYSYPYRFHGCGCIVENLESENKNENENNKYCKDCFESFDEHYEHYKEYNSDEIKEEMEGYVNKDIIYQEKNLCQYQFTKENLSNAKKVLKKLEDEYGELITDFNIEDDKGIRYNVKYLPHLKYLNNIYEDEDTMKKVENIARICLGRQIVYCLEKYGSCEFTAEL